MSAPLPASWLNLFLIGYRGTGKSTVARLLAEQLGWRALDADDVLEREAGRSIQAIFASEGEEVFRDMESRVVTHLASGAGQVIALGGGAVLRPQNRLALTDRGMVIWLDATAETIEQRLELDPLTHQRRPKLTAAGGSTEIRELLARRRPIYELVAHHRVETDSQTPAQVATKILSWLSEQPGWPGLGGGSR